MCNLVNNSEHRGEREERQRDREIENKTQEEKKAERREGWRDERDTHKR